MRDFRVIYNSRLIHGAYNKNNTIIFSLIIKKG